MESAPGGITLGGMSKVQPALSFTVVYVNGKYLVRVRASVGNAVKFSEDIEPMAFLGISDRCEAELKTAMRAAEAECRAAVQAIKDLPGDATNSVVATAQKRLNAALLRAGIESVEDIPTEDAPVDPSENVSLLQELASTRTSFESLAVAHEELEKETSGLKAMLSAAGDSQRALKAEIAALKPPTEPAPGA